jgi:hypothetical protein
MEKLLTILFILTGFSCNPYRQYYFTHYHITARFHPASNSLSANVQMVFVPAEAFHDSITFRLHEEMEIESLAAQELKYYEFKGGRLVLYIEEAVLPGDQLHISLTYRGPIGEATKAGNPWYPSQESIDKMTYAVEMDLPEEYEPGAPAEQKGQRWYWSTDKPLDFIVMPAVRESEKGP